MLHSSKPSSDHNWPILAYSMLLFFQRWLGPKPLSRYSICIDHDKANHSWKVRQKAFQDGIHLIVASTCSEKQLNFTSNTPAINGASTFHWQLMVISSHFIFNTMEAIHHTSCYGKPWYQTPTAFSARLHQSCLWCLGSSHLSSAFRVGRAELEVDFLFSRKLMKSGKYAVQKCLNVV